MSGRRLRQLNQSPVASEKKHSQNVINQGCSTAGRERFLHKAPYRLRFRRLGVRLPRDPGLDRRV